MKLLTASNCTTGLCFLIITLPVFLLIKAKMLMILSFEVDENIRYISKVSFYHSKMDFTHTLVTTAVTKRERQ